MPMHLPEIQAVVFDLDGLMLNTEDIFEISGRQLLERRGMQMTDEIHRRMLGRRPNEAFQALKDLTGLADSIDDLKEETKTLFAQAAQNHLDTLPGLFALLDRIETLGLPKAVATSSPRSYLIEMLNRFQLLSRFKFTLTAEDVTHGKPHPEIYQHAMKLLNIAPENTLVLEDSETGTKAAAAAKAFAVSVPNRHTIAGDFSMANLIVSSLADQRLLDLLPVPDTSESSIAASPDGQL